MNKKKELEKREAELDKEISRMETSEYGLKELIQGILIGLILGFFLAMFILG